jgi:small-conductance mechanosensitive channel
MDGQIVRWSDAVLLSLQRFTSVVATVLPDIIAAILVLVIGLVLAGLLGRLTKKLIKMTRLDVLLEKAMRFDNFKERGIELKASSILGWAVKWFFIIVTFIAAADILNLQQLTNFFKLVALYVPNVIIAILILLFGFILGDGLKGIVIKAVESSKLPKSLGGLLGTVARVSVVVFAIMATLTQLGIASDLVRILFTGFVAMLALAGGLAFGLGSRDHVNEWLNKIRKGL